MRDIKLIVLHCSDSYFGDAALIDRWHKEKGWKGIGYHFVILNGYPNEESFRLKRPRFDQDGSLQIGRRIEEVGAHVRGRNSDSIGICLIGRHQFSAGQFATLAKLVFELREKFPGIELLGHYEAQLPGDPPKNCPNLDMGRLRQSLKVES